MSSTVQNNY